MGGICRVRSLCPALSARPSRNGPGRREGAPLSAGWGGSWRTQELASSTPMGGSRVDSRWTPAGGMAQTEPHRQRCLGDVWRVGGHWTPGWETGGVALQEHRPRLMWAPSPTAQVMPRPQCTCGTAPLRPGRRRGQGPQLGRAAHAGIQAHVYLVREPLYFTPSPVSPKFLICKDFNETNPGA